MDGGSPGDPRRNRARDSESFTREGKRGAGIASEPLNIDAGLGATLTGRTKTRIHYLSTSKMEPRAVAKVAAT
ncbi:hypothetical protein KVA01_00590 [Kocuria varians]|uniref:Uncharacterized protein n=1 Tax=Kocuria varians TaxID=1272 RepID=A0A4Y4D2E2_KOCVA|nr:hypothetical protein KVA01_00590 [Kocuria varians]